MKEKGSSLSIPVILSLLLFPVSLSLPSCGDFGFPQMEGGGGKVLLGDDDGDDDDGGGETPDSDPPEIIHTEIPDGQVEGVSVDVTAEVTDRSGIFSVVLYYSGTDSGPWSQVNMSRTSGDYYSGKIPGTEVQMDFVYYYIRAVDGSINLNTATSPEGAPSSLYDFLVTSSDTSPPTITHTHIEDGQEESISVETSATITDSSGIRSARIYFRESGSSSFTYSALSASGSVYDGVIPASFINSPSVDYYIWAKDDSSSQNEATYPTGAPANYITFDVYQRYDLYYDDGLGENGIIGISGTWLAVRFTPQSYPAKIKTIRVNLWEESAPVGGTGRLRVWLDPAGSGNGGSRVVLTQDFTIDSFFSFTDIDVSSEDIEVSSGDIYVGIGQYESYGGRADFWVGFDDSSSSGRSWFRDSTGWKRLSTYGYYGNLLIRIRYLAP